MSTLTNKPALSETVQAVGVRFTENMVYIRLSDQREIGLPLSLHDLRWLANATPEQRDNWTLGPGGRSVLWDELDDGIEVEHLFKLSPLV